MEVPTVAHHNFYTVQIRNLYMLNNQNDKDNHSLIPLGVNDTDLHKLNQAGVHPILVDSGTTDSYFPECLQNKFQDLFLQLWSPNPHTTTNQDYPNPDSTYQFTWDQVQAMPTFVVQLVGDQHRNNRVSNQYMRTQQWDVASSSKKPATLDPRVPGLAVGHDPDHPEDVLLYIEPRQYMSYNPNDGTWTNGLWFHEPHGGVLGANAFLGHDVAFDMDARQVGWAQADCNYTRLMAAESSPQSTPPVYYGWDDENDDVENDNDDDDDLMPLERVNAAQHEHSSSSSSWVQFLQWAQGNGLFRFAAVLFVGAYLAYQRRQQQLEQQEQLQLQGGTTAAYHRAPTDQTNLIQEDYDLEDGNDRNMVEMREVGLSSLSSSDGCDT